MNRSYLTSQVSRMMVGTFPLKEFIFAWKLGEIWCCSLRGRLVCADDKLAPEFFLSFCIGYKPFFGLKRSISARDTLEKEVSGCLRSKSVPNRSSDDEIFLRFSRFSMPISCPFDKLKHLAHCAIRTRPCTAVAKLTPWIFPISPSFHAKKNSFRGNVPTIKRNISTEGINLIFSFDRVFFLHKVSGL